MTELKAFSLDYTEIKPETIGAGDAFASAGAVIVAAGASTRMGGQNKILLPLVGIPVVVRAAMAFQRHPAVQKIVLVTSAPQIPDLQRLTEAYGLSKVCQIVVGGESREQSVKNGFLALTAGGEIETVLIHDGARPLVSGDVIDRVLAAVHSFSAAVPAVPLKDTVKRVGKLGKIEHTVDRATLAAVQTPQGFSAELFDTALQKAGEALSSLTDDAAVAESAGFPVYTVAGDYRNIKITTPEDIRVAEAYLADDFSR